VSGLGPKPKHQIPHAAGVPDSSTVQTDSLAVSDGRHGQPPSSRSYHAPPVPSARVVPKPVSKLQTQDPREFQISQLKRRFSPTETRKDGSIVLTFSMKPSDPDFPFEMMALECVLHVPFEYPLKDGKKPWLQVKNKEMGRGYQINVERGFATLLDNPPGATLLGLMNALDRRLERLLGEQKADTITFVANRRPEEDVPSNKTLGTEYVEALLPTRSTKPAEVCIYTSEQRHTASERRETEIRQLEARVGRLPLFSKSADGTAYSVPITARRHQDLPVPLRGVQTVKLFVPLLYPLQHCRIELQGVSRDAARDTERGFEQKVKEAAAGTLMGHVNYLAQNMHVLAKDIVEQKGEEEQDLPVLGTLTIDDSRDGGNTLRNAAEDDRSHIKVIPRPPEWATSDHREDPSDIEDSECYDSEGEFSDDGETNGVPLPPMPETEQKEAPERGIALSFPQLELYGIELLELISLCVTIKCERCKDVMDINGLQSKAEGATSRMRKESCKKCALPLSVEFRREYMHLNAARAGYLDLEGCTVVDMLPSNFAPTCSECSTAYPAPGLVSVRGESSMAVCRECHRKMTFKIPEVKFLLVSASARANNAPARKKPKENLGIVAGTELPRRGRCAHYSKSYRWFRFSCCSKVFACDRCHDEASDHSNEHANRMICGHCSREQNYRPEDCGICHMSLIKKVGSGFWEGGKGTRDKARMSRKGVLDHCLHCSATEDGIPLTTAPQIPASTNADMVVRSGRPRPSFHNG